MIKAELTISRPQRSDSKKVIRIQVRDTEAKTTFLEIEITPENMMECLTGLSKVECSMTATDLFKVGKVRESKMLEFPLGEYEGYDYKKIALKELPKHTPRGWIASTYFGSQTSFFNKGEEPWARTSLNKWVNKE